MRVLQNTLLALCECELPWLLQKATRWAFLSCRSIYSGLQGYNSDAHLAEGHAGSHLPCGTLISRHVIALVLLPQPPESSVPPPLQGGQDTDHRMNDHCDSTA